MYRVGPIVKADIDKAIELWGEKQDEKYLLADNTSDNLSVVEEDYLWEERINDQGATYYYNKISDAKQNDKPERRRQWMSCHQLMNQCGSEWDPPLPM